VYKIDRADQTVYKTCYLILSFTFTFFQYTAFNRYLRYLYSYPYYTRLLKIWSGETVLFRFQHMGWGGKKLMVLECIYLCDWFQCDFVLSLTVFFSICVPTLKIFDFYTPEYVCQVPPLHRIIIVISKWAMFVWLNLLIASDTHCFVEFQH